MTLEEFEKSIEIVESPDGIRPELEALRVDARGDWKRAHEIVQAIDSARAAWVHAYLHRKEGDLGNASYWYSRAGKPTCNDDLKAEWKSIASSLLESSGD